MSIKITIPNTSSDYLTFGSANTPTAAQIAGIDSGSSNGQLAIYTTASGTSTERMRIDNAGNVGIGTASPGSKLSFGTAASSPTDTASAIRIYDVGGTNGNNYGIGIDGSTGRFTYTAGTSGYHAWFTANAERMRIDSSGNLLVGTTTAAGRLTVSHDTSGTGNRVAIFSSTYTGGDANYEGIAITKYINSTATTNVFQRYYINNGGTNSGQINANGASAAAFGSFSDARLKENIVDLPPQLANIMSLRPVEFDYIESEGGGHQIGFIAQEVQNVYPDLIGEREDGMLTLTDMNKNDARLIKAIQEQQAIIQTLTDRITALENK